MSKKQFSEGIMTREEAAKRIKELTEIIEYNSRLYYEKDAPEISDYK